MSRRQLAALICLKDVIGDHSSSLACPRLTTFWSAASGIASPATSPSSTGGRQSLRTVSPLFSPGPGGAITHGTASGEEARPPIRTKTQGCPTLKGGDAGFLLGLPCATRQLFLIMLASWALLCPGAGVKEPAVVNCPSLWGSPMFGADAVEESVGYGGVVLGPALSHTLALWLLSHVR